MSKFTMTKYFGVLLKRLGFQPSQSAFVAPANASGPTPGGAAVGSFPLCSRKPAPVDPDPPAGPAGLADYLRNQGNPETEIERCRFVLKKSQLILEIGCGDGNVARRIAVRNPDVGVLATDIYDSAAGDSSHYGRVARKWKRGQLDVQQQRLPNLVLLRATGEILDHLPDRGVDSVLMIHPEPKVAAEFFDRIRRRGLETRFKPAGRSLIVKPFSREIGVMACGGFEFDHSTDWSQGLGFLIESPFVFRCCQPVQWGVNLSRCSPYAGNSTQNEVFYCKDLAARSSDYLSKARLVKNSDLV